MTSSTIQQVPCAFHEVRFSPPTAPCPRCRQEVRRAWEATSNGAERAGRSFRHRQGAHYKLRSTVAIGALMDVAAHERRHARSLAAELAVGRSRRGRRHKRTEEELAAAA